MSRFSFTTDQRSEEFCLAIVTEMVERFGISEQEALGRLNRKWQGSTFVGDDIVYHEDETYWAYNTYYGHESEWWLREGDPTLQPIPYP